MRRLFLSGRVGATLAVVAFTGGGMMVVAAAAPPAAFAGIATLMSCSANGSPAPTDGWTGGGNPGNYSGTYNNCATGGNFGAYVSEQWPQPAGENVTWTFTPPAGSTVAGGTITGALVVPYGQGGQAYFSAPGAAYDSTNVLVNCQWNLPCPQSAAAPGTGSTAGTWPIHPGGSVFAVASCAGLPSTGNCPGGFGPSTASLAAIASSAIELESDVTPSASGFTGSLLTPDAHGTANLQFQASDGGDASGPSGFGVFRVQVLIDGTSVYNATPDANSGKCVSVGTDPGGYAEFLSLPACRLSETVNVPVPTSALADGQHEVKAIVVDAAGNTSTVLDQMITTKNRTSSSSAAAGNHPPSTAPGGAPLGPANGENADANAMLIPSYAATAQAPTVTYARSAMTLSGRLVDHTGAALAGAQVELRQHPAAAGATDSLLATATTTPTGAWTLTAPAGPSRTLTVGYRAHLGDPAFAAHLDRQEIVIAAISLKAPKRTHPGGRVVFTGQLAGGNIPPGGEIVAMQIYFGKKWRTIDLVHAAVADGRWRYSYVFALPRGRYRFRGLVPANPAYPFNRATSQPVSIEVL
jgi:hypothetical protein